MPPSTLFGAHDVGVEVELLHDPRRVCEDDEPELIEAGRARRGRPAEVGPPELAAWQQAGDFALRSSDSPARVDRSRGVHLRAASGNRHRPSPLHCEHAGSNLQRSGFSMQRRPSRRRAHRTRRARPRCSSWRCGCEQPRGRSLRSACAIANGLRGAAGPVEARRAGDDAVEVVREALRLLQRLASAGRAAVPVRELRRGAVVARRRSPSRRPSSRAPRASRSRSSFSGMAEREARAAAGVAGVGRGSSHSRARARSAIAG